MIRSRLIKIDVQHMITQEQKLLHSRIILYTCMLLEYDSVLLYYDMIIQKCQNAEVDIRRNIQQLMKLLCVVAQSSKITRLID